MSQSPFIQCPDCSFISSSQGHLGIHRSKMHKNLVSDNINSVNIARLFHEGKSHYCCLCNNIIASFSNFKHHFSTTHKGVSLNISVKCLICNREFPKSSGAGVHVKRSHKIGKDDPYPLSPSPVMSFVDYTLSQTNSTIASSTQSRRSRRVSLTHSPLSGITSCPSQCLSSTSHDDVSLDTQHVNPPLSRSLIQLSPCQTSPGSTSPLPQPLFIESCRDTPVPVLSDIDLNEDNDPFPSLPIPRYSCSPDCVSVPLTGDPDSIIIPSSIDPSQPSSDPGVAFIGCTAESCTVQSTRGAVLCPTSSIPEIPLTGDFHSINIPSSTVFHQPPSDPGVAFVGCTAESCSVQSSLGTLNGSSLVHDNPSNPTDNLANNPNDLSNLEPSGALSGCTVGDSDDSNTANSNSQSHNSRGKDSEFVRQWYNRISSAASFDDFSASCGLFADEVVMKGKDMSANSRGRPALNPRNQPHGRVPSRNRRPLQFNPRDAKRLQILYRLSKKRAAHQVLNDNNTPYSGTKDRAEQYFNQTFSPPTVDLD